jgi:7SK snRNA methylphosphate capping enzyme
VEGCKLNRIQALAFKAQTVVGVDIDPFLIGHAKSHLSFHYSLTAPQPHESSTNPSNSKTLSSNKSYFPISSVQKHGHRPYPPQSEMDSSTPIFPRNVTFINQDWAITPVLKGHEHGYDTVLALSVLKWIHLHHGDSGLLKCFDKFHSCLSPGGRVVLEIQPWKSYVNAVKKGKAPDLKDNLERLKIKPCDFDDLLQERGLDVFVANDGSLGRRIVVYQKRVS